MMLSLKGEKAGVWAVTEIFLTSRKESSLFCTLSDTVFVLVSNALANLLHCSKSFLIKVRCFFGFLTWKFIVSSHEFATAVGGGGTYTGSKAREYFWSAFETNGWFAKSLDLLSTQQCPEGGPLHVPCHGIPMGFPS